MSRGARSVTQTVHVGTEALQSFLVPRPAQHEDNEEEILACIAHHMARRKCVRGPSGQGTSRLACATWPLKAFYESQDTKHESPLLCCSRITRHESRFTEFTAVRTTAPAGKPLFSCSPLFKKKYCPAPVSSGRPVTAFLRVVARHGAAMARHGRRPPPAPATRPLRFSRDTNHESRPLRFSSHDFPAFPAIIRPPSPLEPVSARRPQPPRRPPGSFRYGQLRMNPC